MKSDQNHRKEINHDQEVHQRETDSGLTEMKSEQIPPLSKGSNILKEISKTVLRKDFKLVWS